ncbi:MAG: hypothetical protein WB762_03105 [Candidatus Sulfotelmatobacter sp.]
MNSRNHVDKSAAEAGKRAAFIVVATLALTLPLQSQPSPIGDSTEAAGSVIQAATAASRQAQQVDQDLTVVKKWIEQPAEKSNPSLAQTARSAPPDNYAALLPNTPIVNNINREVTSKFMFGFRSDLDRQKPALFRHGCDLQILNVDALIAIGNSLMCE